MADTNFPKPGSSFNAGHVPMTEEFDSAKRTLPPIAPLAVALLVPGADPQLQAVLVLALAGSSHPQQIFFSDIGDVNVAVFHNDEPSIKEELEVFPT